MKLIITNADDIFNADEIASLLQKNIITKTDNNDYLIDLTIGRYPENNFSIQRQTLYYGLQWIGTVSNHLNSISHIDQLAVHFNHPFGRRALATYIKKTTMERSMSAVAMTSTKKEVKQSSDKLPATTEVDAVGVDTGESSLMKTAAPTVEEGISSEKADPTPFTITHTIFSHGTSGNTEKPPKRKKIIGRIS